MRFHILTLFPDMVEQGLHTSIIGRAVEKGLLTIEAVNIRDYTLDKHKKVDILDSRCASEEFAAAPAEPD